jgi:heavy metal sensor kinase
MTRTSIRFRLTAWYVAALGLALLLLGSTTFLATRGSLFHWLDETLAERVEALAEEVRLVDGKPRLSFPEELHGVYEGVGDGFMILDGSRHVVLARGLGAEPFATPPVVTTGLSGWTGRGTVSVKRSGGAGAEGFAARRWRVAAHPILSQGKVAAVVLVGHDLEEVDEVLGRLALVMLALLPLALASAGIGGWALAGRALAPVDQITRAAAEISERDLSRRLPVGAEDELGRLATTFNALITRLQRAFERQRQFTADASHELRTPLAIIRAITSQKLLRTRDPADYERALSQIDEAAAYMTRLAQQLLVLARADAGQVLLERERLDLTELLEHIVAQVAEASGRPAPIRAAGAVYVEGDPLRLTELFLHLIENATKYTPPDGIIEVMVERAAANAHVVVRDSGAGIPPEHLPHIFERFYRVDKARAREEGGAGLGLAIGRWIAEAHGGSILAESEPGRGTTMIVTLPLAEERDSP